MYITHLKIVQFRNYLNAQFEFNRFLNIIHGPNGSGKTSILEAIHYLTLSKSFKTNSDNSVLNEGMDFFQVFGNYRDESEKSGELNINYQKNIGKKIFHNKTVLERKTAIIGLIPVVVLSPASDVITHGGPAMRRDFINRILSQVDPEYLSALLEYSKRLTERNLLLNRYNHENRFDYDIMMETQDELLSDAAEILVLRRQLFLNEFLPIFTQKFKNIAHINENPGIKFNFNIKVENVKFSLGFVDKLRGRFRKDVIIGRTGCGPHLDNIIFQLGNRELRDVGSQGENKIFLVALKMAEAEYIESKIGKKVIFLLDDLFAMLDGEHCAGIVREISLNNQTFVTTTDITELENYHLDFEKINSKIIQLPLE